MSERFFVWLGQLEAQHRWPIIVGWLVVAALVTLAAPNLDHVTSSNMGDLLPADAPFKRAEIALAETFPEAGAKTSAAIVLETPNGSIREEPAWTFSPG